jgi:hypothetical protein
VEKEVEQPSRLSSLSVSQRCLSPILQSPTFQKPPIAQTSTFKSSNDAEDMEPLSSTLVNPPLSTSLVMEQAPLHSPPPSPPTSSHALPSAQLSHPKPKPQPVNLPPLSSLHPEAEIACTQPLNGAESVLIYYPLQPTPKNTPQRLHTPASVSRPSLQTPRRPQVPIASGAMQINTPIRSSSSSTIPPPQTPKQTPLCHSFRKLAFSSSIKRPNFTVLFFFVFFCFFCFFCF